MADDVNPTLRAELVAALAVLAPQIRGLKDFAASTMSAELLTQINNQIDARTRRQALIQSVINGLDNVLTELGILESDGYPSLPAVPLTGSLFNELQAENNDIEAAFSIFVADTITAGPMTLTSNPSPPTNPGP